MVRASYWTLTNEQARQESVFHHLTQKQTENEWRCEILVLLDRMAKSSRLPWSTSSPSPLPLHCPMPPFAFPSQLQGEKWLRMGKEIPPTCGHLQRPWPATWDPGGPAPSLPPAVLGPRSCSRWLSAGCSSQMTLRM